MNIQSNQKIGYLIVLFTLVSLFVFSSCGDKTKETPKLDYVTLMKGDYKGSFKVGTFTFPSTTATIKAGSTADEIIFTENVLNSDSTTQFKIQLVDANSQQGIDLFVPQQTIGSVQVVGKVLGNDNTKGNHGYFLYQNTTTNKIINQIVFSISANGGDYVYTFDKQE